LDQQEDADEYLHGVVTCLVGIVTFIGLPDSRRS
jgi:hypothetical protein